MCKFILSKATPASSNNGKTVDLTFTNDINENIYVGVLTDVCWVKLETVSFEGPYVVLNGEDSNGIKHYKQKYIFISNTVFKAFVYDFFPQESAFKKRCVTDLKQKTSQNWITSPKSKAVSYNQVNLREGPPPDLGLDFGTDLTSDTNLRNLNSEKVFKMIKQKCSEQEIIRQASKGVCRYYRDDKTGLSLQEFAGMNQMYNLCIYINEKGFI